MCFSICLLQVHDSKCIWIQVCMPVYLLDAIYHHAVIGLMYITEGVLVIHIPSIVILTTMNYITFNVQFLNKKEKPCESNKG